MRANVFFVYAAFCLVFAHTAFYYPNTLCVNIIHLLRFVIFVWFDRLIESGAPNANSIED